MNFSSLEKINSLNKFFSEKSLKRIAYEKNKGLNSMSFPLRFVNPYCLLKK